MTESINPETGEPTPGIVERLARDDVERKRFLKMAGKRIGAGAAATSLAAFIAACGGSSSASSSSGTASSAAAGTSSATTSSMTSSSAAATGDLAIVNYALTLEYLESQFYAKVIKSGPVHGKDLSVLKTFGAEEAEHVDALKKVAEQLGHAGGEADGQVPAPQRRAGRDAGRDGREPRRRRVSRPGGEHQEQGDPRGRAVDPQHRGAPRGDAEPAAQEVAHPRRRVRQADDAWPRCWPSSSRSSPSARPEPDREEHIHMTHSDMPARSWPPSRSTASPAPASSCAARSRAGAVYGAGAVAPVRQRRVRRQRQRHRHPQLRAHARVSGGRLLQVKGKSVGLSGEAKTLARSFGDEEAEHVAALTKAITSLGGKPVKKPKFAFPVTNQASFLKLAYVLENTGVGAYNGAAPVADEQCGPGGRRDDRPDRGSSRRLHRAAHRRCPITPNGAFDKPLTKQQVLAKAGPLIK